MVETCCVLSGCDQCGILVDDFPSPAELCLPASSRLGSLGSFFAPGTNTRIACYHASLHLLNMLPLSLRPLVGLMCRHGPVFQLPPPSYLGWGWMTARRLVDYPLSGDWCVGDFDQVHGTEGSGWRAGFFCGRTVFKSARKAPIWSNNIQYIQYINMIYKCLKELVPLPQLSKIMGGGGCLWFS